MKFKKSDIVKNKGKLWECIVSDKRTAVFAEITEWNEIDKRVCYENLFAIDQSFQEGFIFDLIKHHSIRVIPDSDGGL